MTSLRRLLGHPGTPWARLALAGLLGFAAAAATIGLLAGSGYVVGRAALRPGLDALVGLLAAIEVLAFMRGPLRYAERLVGHDAALRALTSWRVWLYDRLALRVPSAFADWRSGDLLARAIDDVDALTDLYLRTLLPVVIAVAAAALGVIVEGVVLPVAALALGIPIAIALIVPPLLLRRAASADALHVGGSGELSAQVVDLIHGAPDLLAFGAEANALARIEALAHQADAAERRQSRATSAANLMSQLCLAAALVGVLAVSVAAVHDHHLGRVMVAVLPLAALGAFESVPLVALAVSKAVTVDAAAARLLALEDTPVPVLDPDKPLDLDLGPAGATTIPHIAFDQASLRYDPGLPRALDDVTIDLAPGARLAVTGSSGAGKSSLVSALLRFWSLESGHLRLDGNDAERLRQSDIRSVCALVDQQAHLFAGTVRANVMLGRPEASAQDVDAALAAAQLTDWIAALPDGLDTQVGDDGVAVSGGERRRLAVARALVAGGSVLVLDEPTSGLDTPTADQLLTDVMAAAGSRSVLLITHRDAEAARCQRTVTLEAGRVVAP